MIERPSEEANVRRLAIPVKHMTRRQAIGTKQAATSVPSRKPAAKGGFHSSQALKGPFTTTRVFYWCSGSVFGDLGYGVVIAFQIHSLHFMTSHEFPAQMDCLMSCFLLAFESICDLLFLHNSSQGMSRFTCWSWTCHQYQMVQYFWKELLGRIFDFGVDMIYVCLGVLTDMFYFLSSRCAWHSGVNNLFLTVLQI